MHKQNTDAHDKIERFCRICRITFLTKAAYTVHISVNDGKFFKCCKCNIKKSFKHELRTHILVCTDLPYACTLCPRRFILSILLQFHNARHRSGKQLIPRKSNTFCNMCNKKFLSRKQLLLHNKAMNDDVSTYMCCRCDFKYSTRSYIQRHAETCGVDSSKEFGLSPDHKQTREYTDAQSITLYANTFCKLCNMEFRTSEECLSHNRITTNGCRHVSML